MGLMTSMMTMSQNPMPDFNALYDACERRKTLELVLARQKDPTQIYYVLVVRQKTGDKVIQGKEIVGYNESIDRAAKRLLATMIKRKIISKKSVNG